MNRAELIRKFDDVKSVEIHEQGFNIPIKDDPYYKDVLVVAEKIIKSFLIIKDKEVDLHTLLHTENIDFYNKFSNSSNFLTLQEFLSLKESLEI